MAAGRLDQQVTILERDIGTSSSGSGMAVETFIPKVMVWARVTPLRGGETFTGSQRFESATHAFRIRFRAVFEMTWRLEWRGEQYDVIEALPTGHRQREWLDVIASASPAENAP